MKKLVKIFLIILSIFIVGGKGIIRINAIDKFPTKLTASYVSASDGGLIKESPVQMYKKHIEYNGKSAKAFCTSFMDYQPSGTCNKADWRTGDEKKDKYISYAVGKIINMTRSNDGTVSWTNYLRGECAINRLLASKGAKGNYGTICNSLKTSDEMYTKGLAEYTRAKKRLEAKDYMKIKSAKISKTGNITIQLLCGKSSTDVTSRCKNYNFDLSNIKAYRTNEADAVTNKNISVTNKKITYSGNKATITAKVEVKAGDVITLRSSKNSDTFKINATGKGMYGNYDFLEAANYDCGTNCKDIWGNKRVCQDITPNLLKGITLGKTVTKTASVTIPTGEISPEYNLSIVKISDNNEYLGGAIVNIYKDSEVIRESVEIESGGIGFDVTEYGEGEYCVQEITAPSGYELSSALHCGTISGEKTDIEIDIPNDSVKPTLTINKIDEANNPVVGAKIKVCTPVIADDTSADESEDHLDSTASDDETESGDVEDIIGDVGSEGITVDTGVNFNCLSFGKNADGSDIYYFETGTEPKVITSDELVIGETYTIIEESAPEGYPIVSSQSIELQAGDNVVTMTNIYSSFKVSKVDITSKKELPGALLEIRDSRDVALYSWESTDKPQEITGLSDGEYTLVEKTAPKGYTIAESINFTIENGKLKASDNVTDNTLVMKDSVVVDVPDTFSSKNIITMIIGLVMVGLGTGVLIYEFKQKKTA